MRPNVVLIVAHDVGRHLGCYGVPETGSEHLDRLAAGGVRLAQFYSTSPQCSPARASLVTGRYPHSHGVTGICSPAFGFDLLPDERPLGQLLKAAGYRTALAGLQHETLQPERLGFDEFLADHSPAAAVGQAAARFVTERAGDASPFYLQVGFVEAHRPWRGTQPYAERGVHVPPWLVDEPDARADLAAFQGAIRAMDAGVGHILRGIEDAGLAENTIVLFFSDHGMPYPRAKHSLYDPGCAAAALARWPAGGWSGGRVLETPLSGVDVLPTVLEACGIPVPQSVQGHSFAALLAADALAEAPAPARDVIFTEQSFNAYPDVSRAVRAGHHKLMAHFTPGRAFYDSTQLWHPPARVSFIQDQPRTQHPSLELYDLETDPLETTNLASAPYAAARVASLSALLLTWMQETQDPLLDGPPVPPIYERTMALLRTAGRP